MLVLSKKNNEAGLNGGLNGFWGRLAKGLIKLAVGAVSSIPIIGPSVAGELTKAINDLTDNYGAGSTPGGFWNKTAEYEPTPSEEAILTPWFAKFTTFYKTLATELANSLNQSAVANKVTGLNSVLSKMCVVKTHFAKYETTGLSSEAIKWRSEMIAELLKPLDNIINEEILSGYVKALSTYSVPSVITGYMPLFSSTPLITVSCSRFVSSTGNEMPLPDPIRNPTTTIGIVTTPAVLPVLPTGNTIPNTLPTGTGSGSGKKTFWQKNGLYIGGAGLIAIVLAGGNKKKKKN